jgi:hypothetical protein
VASGWWLVARGNVSACRRVGVSACRRLQSVINFVENSWSLQPCRKAILLPQTPIRRPADTLPQPTTHFEHNETQGI